MVLARHISTEGLRAAKVLIYYFLLFIFLIFPSHFVSNKNCGFQNKLNQTLMVVKKNKTKKRSFKFASPPPPNYLCWRQQTVNVRCKIYGCLLIISFVWRIKSQLLNECFPTRLRTELNSVKMREKKSVWILKCN